MAMTQKQKREAATEAIKTLKDVRRVEKGDTIYTVLAHVSSSKMLRVIRLIQIKDNRPFDLSYRAAQALGLAYDERREGVRVSGCGMDMGFSLVYDLAMQLFGDGYALNQSWL
mgnify:FL=1